MDDRDFFDVLYQQWSKTTGAEDKFWMPEEVGNDGKVWALYAVDERQVRTKLGILNYEADADFIAAIHGSLGDLVRRLHMAIDDAERWEEQRDEQEVRLAELAMETNELQAQLDIANSTITYLREQQEGTTRV